MKNKKIILSLVFFLAVIIFSSNINPASAELVFCNSKGGSCTSTQDCKSPGVPDTADDCGGITDVCCVTTSISPPANTTPSASSPTPGANSNNSAVSNMGGIDIPKNTGLADSPIADILKNLLKWLLGIVGVIALIGFVISGIQYIIATGNEDMMGSAKRNMMYSILGIAVALGGVVIIKAIDLALRATSF